MTGIALAVLLIAGLLLNGLRLRGRAAALPVLPAGDSPGGSFRAVVAEGLTLDDATRRAGAAHADRRGDDIVDLVPRDLPVTAARDLVRHMSPPDGDGPGNGPRSGGGHGSCWLQNGFEYGVAHRCASSSGYLAIIGISCAEIMRKNFKMYSTSRDEMPIGNAQAGK